MAVFFLVSLLASAVGAICGIGGGVVFKPGVGPFPMGAPPAPRLFPRGGGRVPLRGRFLLQGGPHPPVRGLGPLLVKERYGKIL